jgi:hypothetical protein
MNLGGRDQAMNRRAETSKDGMLCSSWQSRGFDVWPVRSPGAGMGRQQVDIVARAVCNMRHSCSSTQYDKASLAASLRPTKKRKCRSVYAPSLRRLSCPRAVNAAHSASQLGQAERERGADSSPDRQSRQGWFFGARDASFEHASMQLMGDTALLEASDNGQVTVKLTRGAPNEVIGSGRCTSSRLESHYADAYVEVIGKVIDDNTIQEYTSMNMGSSISPCFASFQRPDRGRRYGADRGGGADERKVPRHLPIRIALAKASLVPLL